MMAIVMAAEEEKHQLSIKIGNTPIRLEVLLLHALFLSILLTFCVFGYIFFVSFVSLSKSFLSVINAREIL